MYGEPQVYLEACILEPLGSVDLSTTMESFTPSMGNFNKPALTAGGGLASPLGPPNLGSEQHQQDLDQYRGIIKRLHIDEHLSLNEVMDVMKKEYNVTAS